MESIDNIGSPLRVVEDRKASDYITEGQAEVLMTSTNNVFYNPVQEFNRDLSIAVLRLFAEDHYEKTTGLDVDSRQLVAGTKCDDGLTILEALSASGLRSIRYAKEVPGIKEIVANDISESAVLSIQANAIRNGVDHLITASHNDASMLMYQYAGTERFQVVDVDPYGCPSNFLDSAVQCVAEGGLLMVTCTDMAVLAGNSPETCHSKYGAISLKVASCHEMALRIVLQCIESHANRHGRHIVPLLSVSADFYVRMFVKVYTTSPANKRTLSKLSMVYHCVGCHMLILQRLGDRGQCSETGVENVSLAVNPLGSRKCEHCGSQHTMGGPIWSEPIHDEPFVSRLLTLIDSVQFGTSKRMAGMIAMVHEELNDVCLYYTLDKLSGVIHSQSMAMIKFRSALINAGYRVSYSHAHKTSIKTSAPPRVIWDIMRAWVGSKCPVRKERLVGSALAILSKESSMEISFEVRVEANPISRQTGMSRFQENPQAYWGPGTRATSNQQLLELIRKKKENQGKYSKRNRDDTRCSSSKHVKRDDRSTGDSDDVIML